MKRKYSIAVVQLNLNDSPTNNLAKCKDWVIKAANQGAEVICLPELYSSHYFCQSEDVDNFDLAEPLYSTSFLAFSELAKKLGVVIIVPFFEKEWQESIIIVLTSSIPMELKQGFIEKCIFLTTLIFMRSFISHPEI